MLALAISGLALAISGLALAISGLALAISQLANGYMQINLANQICIWHSVSQNGSKMAVWLAKIFGGLQKRIEEKIPAL